MSAVLSNQYFSSVNLYLQYPRIQKRHFKFIKKRGSLFRSFWKFLYTAYGNINQSCNNLDTFPLNMALYLP